MRSKQPLKYHNVRLETGVVSAAGSRSSVRDEILGLGV